MASRPSPARRRAASALWRKLSIADFAPGLSIKIASGEAD